MSRFNLMIECNEFINTAAHELLTPIQPILGLSKIVKDRVQE